LRPGAGDGEKRSSSDLTSVKDRQRQAWAAGDFSRFATVIVIVSELLCETADLRAGQRVLDVACGSGNTAIAAARRNCDVTGLDYVHPLLERGRERAVVERLDVRFLCGDAERLPFRHGSFDAVMSTFGVMFAPDQSRAADELVRVCRPGGRIAMANFPPDSLAGGFFRAVSRRLAPPRGVKPPVVWGTEAGLRTLFGDRTDVERATRRTAMLRHHSPEAAVAFFGRYFGPITTAFAALEAPDRGRLEGDLVDLVASANRSGDATVVVPFEYLEVVLRRR
jgi:SAM-dependent methyltransferase